MLENIVIMYSLGVIGSWSLLRISYSKDGIWENINPTFFDVLMVVTPIVNFMLTIVLLFNGVKKKISRRNHQKNNRIKGGHLNGFFKIKK